MALKPIRIAFIGSRNLHRYSGLDKDIQLCERVCYRMAELGITGVSGLYELNNFGQPKGGTATTLKMSYSP